MTVSNPAVKAVPAALLSLSTLLALSISLLLTACGGGGNSGGSTPTPTPTPSTTNEWAWMSGSSTANATGIYGTLGVASTSNVPGARSGSVTWTDSSGNFWLFGGWGYGSAGSAGYLNDLWGFNPTAKTWTWVSGTSSANGQSVYGTLGTASTSNIPGPRVSVVSWKDSSGNFWLFGGLGYDSTGIVGNLNDLWKFDRTTKEWTWVSGSDMGGAIDVYGTEGLPAATNVPGGRSSAVSWTDGSGNFWLFGGFGNDLWEFSPTTGEWTWMGGSDTKASGVYGTQGVAASGNIPGGREEAVSWSDNRGNLWLFGGFGFVTGAEGNLNDLWEYSPTNKQWTWVSGSDSINSAGVCGTQGVASASYVPGARSNSVTWTDASSNLWLFGGFGFDPTGAEGDLNHLWEFNSTTKEWTWVSGSYSANTAGVYGTQGIASASNVPGARFGSVGWIDNQDNFWLFGGSGWDSSSGSDSTGFPNNLNDLWRYQP